MQNKRNLRALPSLRGLRHDSDLSHSAPTISIIRETKGELPSLPFAYMKDTILGKKYELSVAFIGEKKSHEINFKLRGKDKPTNILSFPLSKNSGEILISLSTAKKDAKNFDKKPADFLGFLFIHGLLHLKGMQHGSTMEKAEKKFCKKFGF